MTAEERKKRQEARKKQAELRAEERRKDEALVLETVRNILKDDRATPTEKLFAIYILDDMRYYHLVPDMPFLKDEPKDDVMARLREKFKDELETSSAAVTADT